MAIYDKPGKGRKQCPGCDKYVAARTLTCPECGHKWGEAKTPVATGPKIYDEPGRGRKECGGCHKYVGVALQECPNCKGETFVKKTPVVYQVPVYDEPGKGRKECAGCHKYVAAPTRTCPCGSTEFVKKTVVVVHDKPGWGRRQCPDCDKYVGRSTTTCACGFDFTSIPEVQTQVQQDRWSRPSLVDVEASSAQYRCGCGLRIVVAPAGKPPVSLKDSDESTIGEWIAKIIAAGHESGYHLSPAALRYYVRNYFYDMGTPELDCCIAVINQFGTVDENPVDEEEEVAA